MKNWEAVKKKISEMNKDKIIGIVDKLGGANSAKELFDIDFPCKLRHCNKYNFECKECMRAFWEEEYQPPKQEKWIVHRTLRTKGIEVYVCESKFANYSVISVSKDITYFTSHIKDNAIEFKDLHSATFVRDKLNETRKGKQYLWVVSKVAE